jgi:hypothetical protein
MTEAIELGRDLAGPVTDMNLARAFIATPKAASLRTTRYSSTDGRTPKPKE